MSARSRAAADTHPGLQRDQNEDRFFFDDRRGIYCVIDGVGGHAAGERAAAIAADTISGALRDRSPSGAVLRDAFVRANDAIYDAASRDAALRGMACVSTLAVTNGNRLRFAHVGDTRLYKIHDGRIVKLTHDQSPVGELEDSGTLTETEAMRHPRRNEIYRDLGSRAPGPDVASSVEVGEAALEPDAALVLCSDGLSDQVSSTSIRRIVEGFAGSPALAVQELLAAANDAGGKDNVTAIVVEGERFEAAVRARGGARAARAAGAAQAAAAPAPAPSRAGHRIRAIAWLLAGLLIGAAASLIAVWAGIDIVKLSGLPASAPQGPRTLAVGLEPSAEFATITEALQQAAPGDTVNVGPGEYREALTLREGVSLLGSRGAVLRPPLGAPPGWVAVTAQKVGRGQLAGFLIAATPDQPMAVGVRVADATIEIDDVEIVGAREAGMELGAGARVTVRRSHIHDNPGSGVIIRAGAEPRLEQNVILQNGFGNGPARPGVLVEPGARPLLVSNGRGGNAGAAVEGWPAAGLADLARRNVLSPAPTLPRARPARIGRRPGAE